MRKGPRVSLEERFFEKVKKGDDCWEWKANKNNKGYGMLGGPRKPDRSGRLMLAHRVSYSLAYGEIPKGKWVLHRCVNPGCVNPEHLFLGNNVANVRDMHGKGRGWGGIGPDTAYAVLWMNASGFSRKQISAEYGVSVHAIKDITQRRSWRSLSELHD